MGEPQPAHPDLKSLRFAIHDRNPTDPPKRQPSLAAKSKHVLRLISL